MSIQIAGNGGVVIGAGEEARKPLHVQSMPLTGNTYSLSAYTTTIGAALAANSEVLQFRFLSSTKTLALVHAVTFNGLGIVAVATAAGPLGFEVVPARSWTGIGSGGTRISNINNNMKLETGLATSQVSDIGISTTGGLTAGTKTLDANAIGGILTGVGTGAVTIYGGSSLAAPWPMFRAADSGNMPLTLGNQEGFVIRTTHAGPASLTYVARFGVVWSEVLAF
jgi:hypothetical protein